EQEAPAGAHSEAPQREDGRRGQRLGIGWREGNAEAALGFRTVFRSRNPWNVELSTPHGLGAQSVIRDSTDEDFVAGVKVILSWREHVLCLDRKLLILPVRNVEAARNE